MAFARPSPELVAAFDAALPADPRVERRSMFGQPCAFVAGRMFAALHEERLALRLPDDRRAELLAQDGAPFEPSPGRVMREYVVVPGAVRSDPPRLRAWLGHAFRHAAALGPKPPRRRAAVTPARPPRRGSA